MSIEHRLWQQFESSQFLAFSIFALSFFLHRIFQDLFFLSLEYLKMWPLLVSVHQPRSCDDIAAAGHPHKPTLVITKLQKNKKQPTSKQMKWTYLQLHLEISDTCSEPVSSNSILVHEWCCQSFVRSLLPFNSEMKARKSVRSSILTGFFSKVSISQPLFEVQE